MSQWLYSTRLLWTWQGRTRIAGLHGRWCTPLALPRLAELELEEVDYTPEVRVKRVRPRFEGWRDMRDQEESEVDAWLRWLFDEQRP